MTDAEIIREMSRQWQLLSNLHDCTIYLCPSDRLPKQDGLLTDCDTRFLVTDGDPALDLEIRETDEAQQIFVRKIGPQARLDAVPFASFYGDYRLPDRIFAPDDPFINDYRIAESFRAGYSLYTEVCYGIRPRSIFEIGIRAGYSAWAMLRGCADGTLYHGIDIKEATYAYSMLLREFPTHEYRIARADSGMLTHLSRDYDLAHVDGNHSHEGALHDLGLCWGHARFILVDDVDAFCTVNSAINEFLEMHPGVPAVRYETQTGHVMLGPLDGHHR
jgi:hypothetical protein